MLRSIFLMVFAVLMTSTTDASAKKVTRTVSVDETFAEFGFNWDGSGGLYMRYRPLNVDGQLELCVVYVNIGGTKIKRLNKSVLKEAKFIVDGKIMMRNLSFADTVGSTLRNTKLAGQQANCVNTGKPFPSGQFQYRMNVRSGGFRAER